VAAAAVVVVVVAVAILPFPIWAKARSLILCYLKLTFTHSPKMNEVII
jgi:hypothetical protein